MLALNPHPCLWKSYPLFKDQLKPFLRKPSSFWCLFYLMWWGLGPFTQEEWGRLENCRWFTGEKNCAEYVLGKAGSGGKLVSQES